MSSLGELDTPAAVVDTGRMQANISRMQQRMNALGVKFRPHVKTSKSLPVVLAQVAALRRKGCDLKIITDSLAGAQAIAAFGKEHGEVFEAWIEVDVDSHR